MTDELEIHQKKQWERIEGLGLLDTKRLYEKSFTKKSPEGRTKPKRYVKQLEKPAKQFYINRKDSPVRNIYEDFTTREEAIKMFDKINYFGTLGMLITQCKKLLMHGLPQE